MRSLKLVCCIGIAAVAAGCAHPMIITPDVASIVPDATLRPIQKNVGYYISPDDRNKEVTSPGGGGDKVTYHPYADMETGYYKMLSNVFKSVTVLSSPNDADAIEKHHISYVLKPEITTDSSSSSLLTWIPTDFTVVLLSKISDATGKEVTSISVTGKGHADFSEFKSQLSLSGQRAALDAVVKTQDALLKDAALR